MPYLGLEQLSQSTVWKQNDFGVVCYSPPCNLGQKTIQAFFNDKTKEAQGLHVTET